MTEITRVPQKEIERRENYLRENWRQYALADPFTWSYPARSSALTLLFGVSIISVHNIWFKKPWYYGFWSRAGMLGTCCAIGYAMGVLRAHNYSTRDAVLEHYMDLHPDDFERVKDMYGRPYKDILLPWMPLRMQYQNPLPEKDENA